MTTAARVTGIRDVHHNVISLLYHTLQEGETLAQYIEEAEQAGDQELSRFFRDVQSVTCKRKTASVLSGQKRYSGNGSVRPDRYDCFRQ